MSTFFALMSQTEVVLRMDRMIENGESTGSPEFIALRTRYIELAPKRQS